MGGWSLMSMSGRFGLYVVAAVVVAMVFSVPAGADILSSHFGVNLQLDTSAYYWDYEDGKGTRTYPILPSSWAPTLNTETVDYKVEDWFGEWKYDDRTIWGDKPSGGEPYDVEALYFDDDDENIYIAIVTSFGGPAGYSGITAGDIALDFGINSELVDGFSYDFGVNISSETRRTNPSSNAILGSSTVGTGFYQTENSDWYLGSPENDIYDAGQMTNFDPNFSTFSGSLLGNIETAYYTYNFGSQQEGLWSTYVIEATISKALFPMEVTAGDIVGMRWSTGCRNDGSDMKVSGTVNTPEPGTLALTAIGMFGLAWVRRRRTAVES